MSEKVQRVRIQIYINRNTIGLKYKFMLKLLDISKIWYIIQRLNSYNLLTNNVAEKVPWTIYMPDEKSKNVTDNWK